MVEGGKTYKIVSVKNGTALDLSGTDGTTVTGWESHDGDNQKWELEENDGFWSIKNVASGRYLAPEGDIGEGTSIVGSDDPYNFDIRQNGDDEGVHRIFVPHESLNVDLDTGGGEPEPGARIQLWGQWDGENQVWRFEEV